MQPTSHPLIDIVAVGLVLSFILGLIANKLKIPAIVGYLLAGIIIGPYTPGFIGDKSVASELAEIGVILLMFGVGLHFSFKDLLSVKAIAVPGAIAQIFCATLFGLVMALILGWGVTSGIVFGLCLSTASTVVLLRTLEEKQLIESHRGRIAVGWLIVEDMIMVFTLIILPASISILHQGQSNISDLLTDLFFTLGKMVLFITIMLTIGTKIIPWLIAKSASIGSRELFTLSVLALAMGIAFGAVMLFQVSFALGAFFAGMLMNKSELSHRAAHDTLPLRDAFAVLFFVSVGMLFNPKVLINYPFAVFSTVVIIILGKSIIAYFIVLLMKYTQRTALLIAASLSQIGEFSFILATLGGKLNVLDESMQSLIVAGAIISILLNPLVFHLVERYLKANESVEDKKIEEAITEKMQLPVSLCNHVILVGYGRVGSLIGDTLFKMNIPLVIIETSLNRVEDLRAKGLNVILGNAAKQEVLQLARLDCARWLLVTTPNGYESGEIVSFARSERPDIEIVARAHYDDEMDYIKEKGANTVVMGEREIAHCMLNLLHFNQSMQLSE